ncbi:hypothetical protein GJ496_001946 [Pomphorhynchus laevis]|nr:hypothetical protein GJ496_001946 [Pomphorhynchus laevis]
MLRRDVPSCMLDLLYSLINYGVLGIERFEYTEHQLEWFRMLCESYHADVIGDILGTTQKEILKSIRIYRYHLYAERMQNILENIPGGTAKAIKLHVNIDHPLA